MNSLQLEVVGVLVRCQKSRQDTKTTRRRGVVEARSQAWSKSVERCRTAGRFPLQPRARVRMDGASLFARNQALKSTTVYVASGLKLEALASEAVVGSVGGQVRELSRAPDSTGSSLPLAESEVLGWYRTVSAGVWRGGRTGEKC